MHLKVFSCWRITAPSGTNGQDEDSQNPREASTDSQINAKKQHELESQEVPKERGSQWLQFVAAVSGECLKCGSDFRISYLERTMKRRSYLNRYFFFSFNVQTLPFSESLNCDCLALGDFTFTYSRTGFLISFLTNFIPPSSYCNAV